MMMELPSGAPSSCNKTTAAALAAGIAALFSVAASAIAAPSPATGAVFRDDRCPFSARFANGATPASQTTPTAQSSEQMGQGFRVSFACIVNPNGATVQPLTGQALHDRLSDLAQALNVRDAKITVPVQPAASCGLIAGTANSGGQTIKTRTQFCYGPRAYFIAETSSDGSTASETAVSSVLASIAAN